MWGCTRGVYISVGVSWSRWECECESPCVCDYVCMLAGLLGRVQGFHVQLCRLCNTQLQGAPFRKQAVQMMLPRVVQHGGSLLWEDAY